MKNGNIIDQAVQELCEALRKTRIALEIEVAKKTGTKRKQVQAILNDDGQRGQVIGPESVLAVFEMQVGTPESGAEIIVKIQYL
jgi:hypothetical protein